MRDVIVLNFASPVLVSRSELPTAINWIYRWYREGQSFLAVVKGVSGAPGQPWLSWIIGGERGSNAPAQAIVSHWFSKITEYSYHQDHAYKLV